MTGAGVAIAVVLLVGLVLRRRRRRQRARVASEALGEALGTVRQRRGRYNARRRRDVTWL